MKRNEQRKTYRTVLRNSLKILFAPSKYSSPAFHISVTLIGTGSAGSCLYLAAIANIARSNNAGTRHSPGAGGDAFKLELEAGGEEEDGSGSGLLCGWGKKV